MKYILVHWTATNETSILTEEFVRDRSMLKDPNKEGMVRFGKPGCKEPKEGWKAYLGRVVFVNERKKFVERREREFLGEVSSINVDNDEEYPASTKGRRKRRISSDSESSNDSPIEETNPKKKIANARRTAQNKVFEEVIGRMDLDSDYESEQMESVEDLKEKIVKLEKDLAQERSLVKQLQNANLMLQKNLPDLLKQTCSEAIAEGLVSKRKNHLKVHQSCQQSHVPLLGQRPCSPLLPKPDSSSPLTQRPCSPTLSSRLDQSTPCSKELSLATKPKQVTQGAITIHRSSDVINSDDCTISCGDLDSNQSLSTGPEESLPPLSSFADSVQVAEIMNTKTERKMTMVLMCILFARKVIASSSVTGKSKKGRRALDPQKVQLIISHVLKRFPKATPSTIKAAMAQKCKDERNATENRKLKAEKE